MSFFELRDPENLIPEVQLIYREVVPRLFEPTDSWNKATYPSDRYPQTPSFVP